MNGLSEIISGSGALFLVFSAAGFAVYLLALNKAPALGRTVAKTMAVGALSGLAFHAGGPALLIVALALSALGDAFLAHEGEAAFLGGLGSFLAAHMCLCGAVHRFRARLCRCVRARPAGNGRLWRRHGYADGSQGGRPCPARGGLCAGDKRYGSLAASRSAGWCCWAQLLFMASDAILGSEKFLMSEASSLRRLTSPAVWVLYYAGQLLITLGLLG
jgi:uncharacterized membrane protein YhhN